MTQTPELSVEDNIVLVPVNRSALTPILNAIKEDPDSAYSALPWLDRSKETRQQIRAVSYTHLTLPTKRIV